MSSFQGEPFYTPSNIKSEASKNQRVKRDRATKVEVEARRDALYDIIEGMHPMTVRQVYYQATVKHLVEKTEKGYLKVGQDLVLMRKNGRLPYDWLTDTSRRRIQVACYDGIEHALRQAAEAYRKDLWADADCQIEIWVEKDALAGVIESVTEEYCVPLMVARGYSSLSFLHEAAQYSNSLSLPTYVYHLGDYDPSGVNAGEKIEETRREMTDVEFHFERLAVTPQQITDWHLPSRPTKLTDSRAKKFGNAESVELDAIDPARLRDLVKAAIERHLSPARLQELKQAEERERALLKRWQVLMKDLGNHLAE
jgi:hypothetical protein